MYIYSLLIFIVILFMIISSNYHDNTQYIKISRNLTIVVCIILVLLAAFRAKTVGTDTPAYILDYKSLHYYSFKSLLLRYEGYGGYYILSKLFDNLGLPVTIWFGFVEAVYVSSMYFFIKKYSYNPLLSILVFITCGLFMFSLAGMKQTLAMGFMMYSFLNFIDKKYIYSIIFAALAFTCHATVLIMLFGYVLYFFRNSKSFYYIVIGCIITVLIASEWLLKSMVISLGNEHYERYLNFKDTYTASTLIFYITIVAIALFGYRKYSKLSPSTAKITLGLSIIACALQSLTSILPDAFRLAYLYTPFFMILISNSISTIKNSDNRNTVNLAMITCLVVFFLYTTRNTPFNFV